MSAVMAIPKGTKRLAELMPRNNPTFHSEPDDGLSLISRKVRSKDTL